MANHKRVRQGFSVKRCEKASTYVIQYVVHFKLVRMLRCQGIELLFQQYIFDSNVSVNQIQFCPIRRVLKDGFDNLQHWGDSSTTGNLEDFDLADIERGGVAGVLPYHAHCADTVWFVHKESLRTLHSNLLPDA